MENQPQIKNSKEIIAFLVERFPACFSLTGEAKPLKVGIFQDIVSQLGDDMPISRTQLRVALRIYTSSWRYLHAIKVGEFRVNLNGEEDAVIEQAHFDYAQNQLKESKEKFNANKKNTTAASAPTKANHMAKKGVSGTQTKKNPVKPRREMQPKVSKQKVAFQPLTDASTLQVGQSVKMMLGNDVTVVTVIEIQKDSIKVRSTSGMELSVRVEHLSN